MKSLDRFLLCVALATWLALPGISGDGGDNAGGTGVWILPRATFLASGSPCALAGAEGRGTISVPTSLCQVSLTADAGVGSIVATFVDSTSGAPVALPASGRTVFLTAGLLQSLRQTGAAGEIVVVDSQLQGYVLKLAFDAATGQGEIVVY